MGDLKFSGSCTANLLWFNRGFQIPEGGVDQVGRNLIKYFTDNKIVEAICKTLRDNLVIGEEKFVAFRLDSKIGYNYLNIFKWKDAILDGNQIRDLVLRIHLCNDDAKMKAKIVSIIDIVFKSELSVTETIDLEIKVIQLERELCNVVYNSLMESDFSLGGRNYECSIYSIGSSDKDLSTIIEAKTLNIESSDPKLIDSYRVLLLDGVYISEENLPMEPKSIVDLINQKKVEKFKIMLHDPDGELVIDTINYEIEDSQKGNSFMITNLVKKDAEKVTTNNFLVDLLDST